MRKGYPRRFLSQFMAIFTHITSSLHIRRQALRPPIDWSGFSLGDYRYDLAWTLLLVSTSGYPELRDLILSEYARLAGKPVEQIEYFDVLAVLRRLVDFSVSLGSGAEAMGMRSETVAIMRGRGDHYRQVYAILQDRTGLQIPEIEQLLDSLDSPH